VSEALQVVTRTNALSPFATHVWRSITQQLPLMSSLHSAINHNPRPRDFQRRLDPSRTAIWDLDWNRTFADCFLIKDRSTADHLVPVAQRVQSDGSLSVIDLAIGILQSGSVGSASTSPHACVRKTNLVILHLLTATGQGHHLEYDEQAKQFELRLIDLLHDLSAVDQSISSQQFMLFHDGSGYRFRPFGAMGAYRFDDDRLPDGTLWIARGDAIQPFTFFEEGAILELEELINRSAPERAFQEFFEAHSEFLLGLGPWKRAHSQLIIHGDDGRLIPDFFLERLDSNFVDICDLKRSNAELIRSQRNRNRFRDAIMEGVAQLDVYRS
jgi:hypothetical protein